MNKILLVFFAVCFSILSFGATFTVSNTNDTGAGSLRQAILDANTSSATPHNIIFSVAGSLQLVQDLPAIKVSVNIIGNVDGNNEPTFKVLGYARYYDENLTAKDSLYGFLLNANNIKVKNVWFENFYNGILLKNCDGGEITNNRIYKCLYGISTDVNDNTARESHNLIIKQNKINWFKDPYFENVSYNCNGDAVSNPATDPRIIYFSWHGIDVKGKKNTISNNTIGYCRYGIYTQGDSLTINNNSIGIDDTNGDAISFYRPTCGNDETIGIFTSGEKVNILSNTIGNMTDGVMTYYAPATPKTRIENNRIGSDAFGNNHAVKIGMYLYEREHIVKGNIITNYTYRGIWLNGISGVNSRLIANTITSTYPYTVAIADYNNVKSAPTYVSYTSTINTITVNGKSIAGDTIDVFTNNAADENAIDFINYSVANSTGDWQLTFNKSVFEGRLANNFIVTVARDISGNSSILSSPFRVSTIPGCWVFNTNDSGPGSLREAINCANSNVGVDTIKFEIQGATAITLTNGPLNVNDDVVIAGQSQLLQGVDSVSIKASFPIFINNSSSGKLALNTLNIETTGGLAILNSALDAMIDIKNSRITSVDIGLLSNTPRSFIFVSSNRFYCKQPLKLEWVKSALIENNKFLNADIAISIYNQNAYLASDVNTQLIILNNTFLNATSAGISLESCSGTTVTNNNFQDCVNPFYSLYQNRGSSSINFSKINQNVFNNSKYKHEPAITINETGAIFIISEGKTIIDSNIITNSEGGGIYSAQSTFEITNNYIANNKGNGQSIYNLQNSIIENNTYENNLLNGFLAGYTSSYKNNKFIKNKFIKNEQAGFKTISSIYNNFFESNEFADNKLFGIQTTGTASDTFKLNVIKNNPIGLSISNGGISYSKQVFESNIFNNPKNIEIFNVATSAIKLTKNLIINGNTAIDLRLLSANPGNNGKLAPTNLAVTTGYILTGKAAANDTIEIFAATPGLSQSAIKYLGHVQADGSGNWTYNIMGIDASIENGIVTTATDAAGNTSQLSAQVLISPCTKIVTNTNDAGPGSFRACIECANANGGNDTIKFAIPAVGPKRIKLVTKLPVIGNASDQLYVDGDSQSKSGAGSGSQEIIVDGSNEVSNNTFTVWATNATISSITFKHFSAAVTLKDATVKNCKIDSCTTGFGFYPYGQLFSCGRNIIKKCEITNVDLGISFTTDGGGGCGSLKIYMDSCYIYKSVGGVSGAFRIDTMQITNSTFGMDPSGILHPLKTGVNVAASISCILRNNKLYTESGVILTSLNYAEVSNNTFVYSGTTPTNAPLTITAVTNNLIIKNNIVEGSPLDGIKLVANMKTIVEGNIIKNNAGNGFNADSNNDTLRISNNQIYSNGKQGFNIVATKKLTLLNNVVGINGNSAAPNGLSGIYIQASTIDSISNNTVANHTCGLVLAPAYSPTNKKAIIFQNTLSKNDTAIFITNSSNGLNIKNNTINNCSAYGIYLNNGSSSSTFQSNVISNSRTAVYGIGGVSNNTFISNTISQNPKGIEFRDGSSNNTFLKNTFGNTQQNIVLYNGSSQNKISQNKFIAGDSAINLKLVSSFGAGNNAKAAPTNLSILAGTNYTITGTSGANDSIELFVSDPLHQQYATKFAGNTKADASGNWVCAINGVDVTKQNTLLAIATDAAGNTSQVSGQITIYPCTMLVTNTNDTGVGSLRACIECANANAGMDSIKFAVPGAGPYEFLSTVALTDIGTRYDSIVLDGVTQQLSAVGTGNQKIIINGDDNTTYKAINSFIKNVTFKNLDSGIDSKNAYFERCSFDTCYWGSVARAETISSSNKNKIIDCDFTNTYIPVVIIGPGTNKISVLMDKNYFYNASNALYSSYTADSLFLTNNIFGKNRNGEQELDYAYSVTNCSNANYLDFRNNEIYSRTFTSALGSYTLNLQTNKKISITDNIFSLPVTPNSNDYLYINNNDTVIIKNNRYTGGEGFRLNGNKYSVIQDNILNKASISSYCYSITNKIFVLGNKIDSAYYALSISGPMSAEIRDNEIGLSGNLLNTYKGIDCSNGTDFMLTGNKVRGYSYGIYLSTGSGILTGNTVFDCATALSGYQMSNSTISNNTFRNNTIGAALSYQVNNNKIVQNIFNNANQNLFIQDNSNGNKISANTFLTAPIAINLNRASSTPGNNNKDTATISNFVQTASYIDLVGKGLNADTIEVFNGNGIKEQTTKYVNHTKVAGSDWTLRVPVNAGYNPVANNYYLVTATDVAGNTSQLSNFIKVPLKLLSNRLNVLADQGGICLGDSTQINAIAEDVTYYKWYNKTTGAIVSTIKNPYFKKGGDYVLEVGDSFGNTASDTIHIIENSLPLASDFLMASEAGMQDNIVAIDISYTKPDSLIWNWGAATAVFNTDKYLLTFPATGTYTIGLTSYLGMCAKYTSHDIVIVPGKLSPDVDTIYSSTIVSLASGPNPVTTDITFKAELAYNEIVTTYIYNLLGGLIYTYQTPIPARSHTYQIDMSTVASGTYIVKVLSGTDQRVLKIIKQ